MTLVIFFLDSMELLYKTSDGIQQSDDVTWLNRKDYRLSLKVSKKLGFNRASAVQSMDFAATNQRELAAWKTFLTTLRVKILTIVRKTNCWIDTELTNVWQVNAPATTAHGGNSCQRVQSSQVQTALKIIKMQYCRSNAI